MAMTREMEKRMLLGALQSSTDSENIIEQPIWLRLMSINGNLTDPGTEITGTSYSPTEAYFVQSATTPAVEVVNSSSIQFNSLDPSVNVTVAGVELWDSSDTPIRLAYSALSSPITVAAGAPMTISPGQLKVRLS